VAAGKYGAEGSFLSVAGHCGPRVPRPCPRETRRPPRPRPGRGGTVRWPAVVAPCWRRAVRRSPPGSASPAGFSTNPKWGRLPRLHRADRRWREIGCRGSKPLTGYFPRTRRRPPPASSPARASSRRDHRALRPRQDGSARLGGPLQRITRRSKPVSPASPDETRRHSSPSTFLADRRATTSLPPPSERRARLEVLTSRACAPSLSQVTGTWNSPAGGSWSSGRRPLDGVIAKPLQSRTAGQASLLKVKHERTARWWCSATRPPPSGTGVGCSSRPQDDGRSALVKGAAPPRHGPSRRELVTELEPFVIRDTSTAAYRPRRDEAGSRLHGMQGVSYVRIERCSWPRCDTPLEGPPVPALGPVAALAPDRDARSGTFEHWRCRTASYDSELSPLKRSVLTGPARPAPWWLAGIFGKSGGRAARTGVALVPLPPLSRLCLDRAGARSALRPRGPRRRRRSGSVRTVISRGSTSRVQTWHRRGDVARAAVHGGAVGPCDGAVRFAG
jgi:hypothetical protein